MNQLCPLWWWMAQLFGFLGSIMLTHVRTWVVLKERVGACYSSGSSHDGTWLAAVVLVHRCWLCRIGHTGWMNNIARRLFVASRIWSHFDFISRWWGSKRVGCSFAVVVKCLGLLSLDSWFWEGNMAIGGSSAWAVCCKASSPGAAELVTGLLPRAE